VTFNIGSQTGGVINNVGRDQQITGGQQGIVVPTEAARQAVRDLIAGLNASPLDATTAQQARNNAEEIGAELGKDEPDRPRVANALERLTRLLTSAGSLATAGAALVGPLQTLASWLGELGGPVLQMLPLLA
jgi:hypothetical protein